MQMSSSNNQTSTQKAYEIGKSGGTVNTKGMADQTAKQIDAAVNAGRKDSASGGKK
jgi:hypothetical protein